MMRGFIEDILAWTTKSFSKNKNRPSYRLKTVFILNYGASKLNRHYHHPSATVAAKLLFLR